MADNISDSNDDMVNEVTLNDNSENVDHAINDIDKAMQKFEQLLVRHSQAMIVAGSRKKSPKSSILKGIGSILAKNLFTGGDSSSSSNRFPVSGGQFFADLASSLKSFSLRNL